MARSLEEHFKQAIGNLGVQLVIIQSELEKSQEALIAANSEIVSLRQKYEPNNNNANNATTIKTANSAASG